MCVTRVECVQNGCVTLTFVQPSCGVRANGRLRRRGTTQDGDKFDFYQQAYDVPALSLSRSPEAAPRSTRRRCR